MVWYYCNGYTPATTTLTVTTGSSVMYQSGWINNCFSTYYHKQLTLTLGTPVSYDISITFNERVSVYHNYEISVVEYRNFFVTIPAGQTVYSFYRDNKFVQQCQGNPAPAELEVTYDNWIIINGSGMLPVTCLPPAPTCHLTITGVTTTNETVSGLNNGSITVGISGSTGGIVYYTITSAYNVYNNTTGIFTGLKPTTYYITITQATCLSQSQATILQGEFISGKFTVSLPPLLAASENPMMVELSTAINSVSPTNSIIRFDVTGNVKNNDSIQFLLSYPEAYTITFVAKGYPNQNQYFLENTLTSPAGVAIGTNSKEDIAVSLAECFQKDAVLPRAYYINNSGTTITLVAKDNTVLTNLDNTNVVFIGTGITMTQLQPGLDAYQGSKVNKYGVYTEVYLNDSGQFGITPDINNFNRIAELDLPYNQSNVMQFKIDEILKNYVYTPKIDFTFSGATTLPSMLKPYYVNYGEIYPLITDTNTVKKKQKSSGHTIGYVINSALPWTNANTMTNYLGNWNPTGASTQVVTGVTFLTNSPNPKLIQRNSTEFLYYIMPANYGHATELRGDIYFYDGSSLINHKFFDIFTGHTNFGGVLCLNVGYDKLGLHAIEVSGMTTRKIKQIDFAVHELSGTTQYSVTRSFIYAVDDALRRFGVAFQNKLGGYDVFDCVGIVEDTLDRQAGSYAVPRLINADGSSPLGFNANSTYNTKETKTITVNTGWLNSAHYLWLQELLASNKIYSYTEPTQPYLNVTAFTYKKSSLEDLFDAEISFSYTLNESNISI